MPAELKQTIRTHGISLVWTAGKIGLGSLLGVLIAWQTVVIKVSGEMATQKAFNAASLSDRQDLRIAIKRLSEAIDGREGLQATVAKNQATLEAIVAQLGRVENRMNGGRR